MARLVNRIKIWLEWRQIIKAQQPWHEVESRKAYEFVMAYGDHHALDRETLWQLISKNDPHNKLDGHCRYCGAAGPVLRKYGFYPCVKAPYWADPEAVEDAEIVKETKYLLFA